MDIVVWGTGEQGKWFLDECKIFNTVAKNTGHEVKIIKFLDSNDDKIKKPFEGYFVELARDNLLYPLKYYVVIAIQDNSLLIAEMTASGYKYGKDFIEATEFFAYIVNELSGVDIDSKIKIYDDLIKKSPCHKWMGNSIRGREIFNLLKRGGKSADEVESSLEILENSCGESSFGMNSRKSLFELLDVWPFSDSHKQYQEMYAKNVSILRDEYGTNCGFSGEYKFFYCRGTVGFYYNHRFDLLVSTMNCYSLELSVIHELFSLDFCKGVPANFLSILNAFIEQREVKRMISCINTMLRQKVCSGEVSANLQKLVSYGAIGPDMLLLNAKYYFLHENFDEAMSFVEKGLSIRKLNFEMLVLKANILEKKGNFKGAVYLYAKALLRYVKPSPSVELDIINIDDAGEVGIYLKCCLKRAKEISEDYLSECLQAVSSGFMQMRNFPFMIEVQDADSYQCKFKICVGRDGIFTSKDERYIVGVYSQHHFYAIRKIYFKMTGDNRRQDLLNKAMYDAGWEIQKADFFRSYESNEERSYILPLMATADMQWISIKYNGKVYDYKFNATRNESIEELVFPENEWKFIKVNKPVKIASDEDLGIGRPVYLNRSKSEKKVVINILVDGLSGSALKGKLGELMPNTERFFSRGIIFQEVFSPNEWTIPSVAAMFFGINTDKTQIFHPSANIEVAEKYESLAEKMSGKGFYCVNLSLPADIIMLSGVTRGFDYQIARKVKLQSAIMKTIEILNNLDTDIFINIHFMEVHDSVYDSGVSDGARLALDVENLLQCDTRSNKSAKLAYSVAKNISYETEIRNCDALLDILYRYLEREFAAENVFVTLEADHGMSIVGKERYLLKEGHTNVPLMVRGFDVPELGVVDDEILSGIDIYKIYAKCCGFNADMAEDSVLPKALGGKGRTYVFTQSIYPSQTYKLDIRSLNHEFYLETFANTQYDGSVDMSSFRYRVYDRKNGHREIVDEELAKKFIDMAYEHTKNMINWNWQMRERLI